MKPVLLRISIHSSGYCKKHIERSTPSNPLTLRSSQLGPDFAPTAEDTLTTLRDTSP
jgi:hypothetical protein